MSGRWVVGLLILCAVLFGALHLWNAQQGGRWDPVCDHASFRTNEWGTQAARELLTRLGLRTWMWTRPWTELSPAVRQLWVIHPVTRVSEDETRALLRWISSGGTAILAPDPRTEERGVSGGRPAVQWAPPAELGLEVVSVREASSSSLPVASNHPLLKCVEAVSLPGGWRLTRKKGQRASGLESPRPGVGAKSRVAAAGGPKGRPEGATAGGPPRAAGRAGPGGREFGGAAGSSTRLPEMRIGDAAGAVAVSMRRGRGTVIALCDADALSNSFVGNADNAVLVANIGFSSADGAVWFDEYHHGRVTGGGGELDTTAARQAIWAALVALAVYALGKLRRFGPVVPSPPPGRRSGIEYVQAFSSLYRQAGHRKAILDMMLERLHSRLAVRTGVALPAPGAGSPEDVGRPAAQMAARLPWLGAERLVTTLTAAHEASAQGGPRNDVELLSITRDLSALQQEVTRYD